MLGVTSEGLWSSQAVPEPQLPTIPAPASPCRRPSQSPSLRHWDLTGGPMQHSPEDLKRRLLTCIDEDCNVTDMAGCLSVITILEQTPITRKILEDTRLGKYVNDIRRRTRDQELPKRLKSLVRKWRDACQAECVNGVSPRGPGPGGGGGGPGTAASANGRQSISPPFSAPSSIKGSAGGLSPCSLPSSGNTSPMGRASAPTTPSTLASRSRTLSPSLSVAKGHLSAAALHAKAHALSPGGVSVLRSPALSPQATPGSSKPQSPALSNPPVPPPPAHEAKVEATYTPRIEHVPRTNAANKRLRKTADEAPNEAPPPKRPRNNLSNGFEDDCSRDSFCSVASVDRTSRASGEGGENVPHPCQDKGIRKSGRRRKNTQDSHTGSAPSGGAVDPLRQKMAVIGAKASTKVKTTSELVAELARRKGDALLARRASRLEEQIRRDLEVEQPSLVRGDHDLIKQNKKEHMEKFLKSQQPGPPLEEEEEEDDDEVTILEDEDEDDSEQTSTMPPSPPGPPPVVELLPLLPPSRPDSPPSNMDLLGISVGESAEEILSRLPPLDVGTIVWDESPPPREREEGGLHDPEVMSESSGNGASEEDEGAAAARLTHLTRRSKRVDASLVQMLHTTNVDCQNGNFDMDGRFREWHEVILQKAYQDSPLVVLPYVITDF